MEFRIHDYDAYYICRIARLRFINYHLRLSSQNEHYMKNRHKPYHPRFRQSSSRFASVSAVTDSVMPSMSVLVLPKVVSARTR